MKAKRRLRWAFLLLLILALVRLPRWLGDALEREHTAWLSDRTAAARSALKITGLSSHAALACNDALNKETHGGFHGDGDTTTLFLVPYGERRALLQTMANVPGWHTEAVSMHDFRAIAKYWIWEDVIAWPAPDTVFEAWYHCNDQGVPNHSAYSPDVKLHADDLDELLQPNPTASVNRRIAFYDLETGLFYFYEQDS